MVNQNPALSNITQNQIISRYRSSSFKNFDSDIILHENRVIISLVLISIESNTTLKIAMIRSRDVRVNISDTSHILIDYDNDRPVDDHRVTGNLDVVCF